MGVVYLVRYGLMHQVGRFEAGPEIEPLARGASVVVRTPRGLELGEVLTATRSGGGPLPDFARVVRAAGPKDRERARLAWEEQPRCLADCERVFREGTWPIVLIDVEVLADLDGSRPGRIIVHYLGPHHLDTTGLSAVFRNDHGLDVLFEPAGCDEPEIEEAEASCGSCGEGGGCGSASGGCGSESGGACSGCAVKGLVGQRRQALHA